MMLAYLPAEKVDTPASGDRTETDNTQNPDSPEEEASSLPDALLDQDVIDVEKALRRCGDPEIYLEVLRSYYDSMVEIASSLNGFLEENDLKNYRIKIHAVKSSSRTVGAEKAGEMAAALEKAAGEEDRAYIDEHKDDFMAEYGKIRGLLSKVFG